MSPHSGPCRFGAPPNEPRHRAYPQIDGVRSRSEPVVDSARLAANLDGIIFIASRPGTSGGKVIATEVARWHESACQFIMDPEKTGGIVDDLARVEGSVERFGKSVQRLCDKKLISVETANQY